MNKLVKFITAFLIISLLSGCNLSFSDKEEEIDYNSLIKNGINSSLTLAENSFIKNSCVSSFDVSKTGYAKHLFSNISCDEIQQNGDVYTALFLVPSSESLANIALNDEIGFMNDIQNMISLNSPEEEIQEYVLNYLVNASKSADKEKINYDVNPVISEDTVLLEDDSYLNDFYNSFIINLPEQLFNYVVNGIPLSLNVELNSQEVDTFTVGKGKLLNYPTEFGNAKIFVKPTFYAKGEEAISKIAEINESNSEVQLGDKTLYYVESEITNLENVDVLVDNPYKLVDKDYNSFTFSGFNFIGINSKVRIPAGETKAVSAVFIGDIDELSVGWYNSTEKLFITFE